MATVYNSAISQDATVLSEWPSLPTPSFRLLKNPLFARVDNYWTLLFKLLADHEEHRQFRVELMAIISEACDWCEMRDI